MNKFKAIIMILCASFIGIISNPEMLAASDSVSVTGLDDDRIVETVLKTEPEIVHEDAILQDSYDFRVNNNLVAPVVYDDDVVEPVYYTPLNYININGDVIELADTSSTDSDAGYYTKKAWYYKSGKYIYGHNSNMAFAGLYNLGVGSDFTVMHGGVSRTYIVSRVVIFDVLSDNYTLRSTEDGRELTMYPITNARYDGVNHAMALMTCYGAGSSQRYVIFAD